MTLALFIYIAGLFTGSTVVLIAFLRDQKKLTKQFDAERMKLLNKMFVRAGSEPLFSAEEIGGAVPDLTPTGSVPLKFTSPFNSRKKKLHEQLEDEHKATVGAKVPDAIKERIQQRAEEAKAAAA